jgi:hypothetical protein
MTNEQILRIKYNLPQLCVYLSTAKVIILEWGRGTGKSFILAKRMIDCVHQLPRSTGFLYGESYQQIKTRTLPSTIKGLEEHGYKLGQHFFVGTPPPKDWHWPLPYEKILDYKNVMIWYTGAVVKFISQDGNASSGRGGNGDWLLGDEALLFNGEKFMTDASATIRGGLTNIAYYPDGTWKYFKDCHLHHSIMLASSTPLSVEGQWFLKYEEAARKLDSTTLFLRASSIDNIENLGADWIEKQREVMTDFLFDAEILNIRVSTVKDGFYPKLMAKLHEYSIYRDGDLKDCSLDTDLASGQPLICGVDWGANINCLVASQRQGNELKVLKNLFVKSPKILDDLAQEFIDYYEPHKATCNVVKIWYDPSGNVSTANSRLTYAKQFETILRTNGWNVELMTRGTQNHSHEDKYNLCNILFSETDTRYPHIRFNKHNCKELLISMKNAPAKRGTVSSIQKVKASEKNRSMLQEHATHFSDTFDLIAVGMFIHIYKSIGLIPMNQVR